MIPCPNCKSMNTAGAIYCGECGAHLVGTNQFPASMPVKGAQPATPWSGESKDAAPSPASNTAWGTLHLMETGQVISLADRVEFTLGRVSEGQPIMPDLDLSVYKAYAGGVSRLHAIIKREGQRIIIMDLGSSNGTYVNGKRLDPNVEQVVKHGDIITLGKLKMQILLKS